MLKHFVGASVGWRERRLCCVDSHEDVGGRIQVSWHVGGSGSGVALLTRNEASDGVLKVGEREVWALLESQLVL